MSPEYAGFGHIAVLTADLDRFRRFYEGVLGVPMATSLRVEDAPFSRHAFFAVTDLSMLHVFEVPGYDPEAQGIGKDIGERGRVDHFALLVRDETALMEMRERLLAAGATDGTVTDFGPVLSVHVTDPDGLQLEINCPNGAFDHDASDGVVEELGLPGWAERMIAAASPAAS
jgi:catechol 2,3-dioxygenase-like lactoylglutathione lyase family enzyme